MEDDDLDLEEKDKDNFSEERNVTEIMDVVTSVDQGQNMMVV